MSARRVIDSAAKTDFEEKRKALIASMEELQASIDFIDWKQGFYDDVLARKTAYYSNLIPEQWRSSPSPDISSGEELALLNTCNVMFIYAKRSLDPSSWQGIMFSRRKHMKIRLCMLRS